jgi:hypothetical protein
LILSKLERSPVMPNITDATLGVHSQARAILALLDREPDFAKYENGFYDVNIATSAWYNGRERGYALVLSKIGRSECLVITFGESRGSDSIFVDSWTMVPPLNPPTVANFPEGAYNTRKHFEANETAKAADYIYEALEAYYNEMKQAE